MKKVIVACIIILVSISTLFRGLYFAYETYGFMAALALLSILYFLVKMKNNEPVHINKLFLCIGLMLSAANVISFANAANPRENLGTLLLYSELLVLFIILYDYFYERKQQYIRCLMIPMVMAGFVSAVIGTIALTGRLNIWGVTAFFGRLGTTFQYANTAAIYFVICFIFATTLVNTEKNIFVRALAAGMGSIFLYAFFMTGSRGGYLVMILIIPLLILLLPTEKWINTILCLISIIAPVFLTLNGFNSAVAQHSNSGAAVSLAASFIISAVSYALLSLLYGLITKGREPAIPKGTRYILGGLFIVGLVIMVVFRDNVIELLPPIMANRLNKLMRDGFNDINILIRLHYDIDALKLIAANWLTGLGGGGWKAMYQSVQDYSYTAAFVHNHYFQVFVENGILGFVSFISMVIVSIAGCIYTYVKNKGTDIRTYTVGLLCALVSLAGHAAGDFDLSFVSLLLLLWAMFAAGMTGTKELEESDRKIGKWQGSIAGNTGKLILIVVCSAMFSFYGMYFLGAYNENAGFIYDQKNDYKTAVVYYEEAHRFDPGNSFYSFELAKLYHHLGRLSTDSAARRQWFDKARQASERSVRGNKNYPAYMNTLVNVYLDSGMPLEALKTAEELVVCQKYNSQVYELLARSYVEAAHYYEDNGEVEKAKALLKKCIDIDQDPYLRRSGITKPQDIDSEEIISSYKHSNDLEGYLDKALSMYEVIK